MIEQRTGILRRLAWAAACLALAGGSATAEKATGVKPARRSFRDERPTEGLLAKMLAGPLKDVEEVVFAVHSPTGWHWYETFGYVCENPRQKKYSHRGRLVRLNLRTGEAEDILVDLSGSIRDPCVSYDGKRVLFSYRKGGREHFNLYEIGADGKGLRQITDGPWDDIEPVYVPDGGIVFCSGRCKRWVPCFTTPVAILYRCEADGSGLRALSSNVEHDNTPWVMPDGRILYTRWEYVLRGVMSFHHLWTMNPDGTGQMVYFGNALDGTLMIDAKPIPGSDRVAAIFGVWHGGPEHNGCLATVHADAGPDHRPAARVVNPPGIEWKEPEWRKVVKRIRDDQGELRDPYPISDDCYLVAWENCLLVMDGRGRFEVVHRLPGRQRPTLHEPRPLVPRPREPVIAPKVDLAADTAHVMLTDVTIGRNMDGVEPGDVASLLILEDLAKPVTFGPTVEPQIGQHNLQRIVGEVPVEPDGSAWFEVPAGRSLLFVALDANGRAVKPMRSFVTFMPGEVAGCVGCHEHRSMTPPDGTPTVAALRRPPSRPEPPAGIRHGVIDFGRDVQPILDRHCVRCHNSEAYRGGVLLVADRGPAMSIGYATARKLYNQGGGDGNVAPYRSGSGDDKLLKHFGPSHHDVTPTAEELRIVRLWLDSGATGAGTYAALGSGIVGGESELWNPLPAEHVAAQTDVLQRRCDRCHMWRKRTDRDLRFRCPRFPMRALGPVRSNLDHPEKSIVLRAPLAEAAGGLGLCKDKKTGKAVTVFADTSDPDYRKLLGVIRHAAGMLRKVKRYDMPGFVPNEHYIREMKRYGVLPRDYRPGEDPIDVYEVDQAYWKSFWPVPQRAPQAKESYR